VSATHLLVGNATAQSGKNQGRIDRARALLRASGIACDFLPTEPHGKTTASVARVLATSPYTCVIAMGGDGTFREVGAGVLDSPRKADTTLAMLPTGTANDQGRSFGLDAGETSLERNVQVIAAGRETRLDAGRIELPGLPPQWFFDSAGWGLSARVLRERNVEREAVAQVPVLRDVYRDQLVYASALLRVFMDSYVVPDKFDATVIADGKTIELEGLTDLVVKNTRIYGGAWVFDRRATHDDGLFEIVPFRGKRDWASKAIVDLEGNPVTEDVLNAIGVEHSKPIPAAHMSFTFRPPKGGAPFCAQMDGEELAATEAVRVDVVARALRLVIPA
jgi:diacylglycerol kinase family enzyme